MVRSLHLNTLVGRDEPLGLEAVNQADLLTRIQQAQSLDENLQKVALNDKTEYQITSNRTILVNGRVSVPKSKDRSHRGSGRSIRPNRFSSSCFYPALSLLSDYTRRVVLVQSKGHIPRLGRS